MKKKGILVPKICMLVIGNNLMFLCFRKNDHKLLETMPLILQYKLNLILFSFIVQCNYYFKFDLFCKINVTFSS